MLRRFAMVSLALLSTRPALALYDPKPDAALAGVQGEWKGTLTYRDYSKPDRLVTLPTRLFVALSTPQELVLHFVFDDGPAKTVFSYDKMKFDLAAKQLSWASGSAEKPPQLHSITATSDDGAARQLTFERPDGEKIARFVMFLSPKQLTLSRDEVSPGGEARFRNRYEFTRVTS